MRLIRRKNPGPHSYKSPRRSSVEAEGGVWTRRFGYSNQRVSRLMRASWHFKPVESPANLHRKCGRSDSSAAQQPLPTLNRAGHPLVSLRGCAAFKKNMMESEFTLREKSVVCLSNQAIVWTQS